MLPQCAPAPCPPRHHLQLPRCTHSAPVASAAVYPTSSQTPSNTPTATLSPSSTWTSSQTSTATVSITASQTISGTRTATQTPTVTRTQTATQTAPVAQAVVVAPAYVTIVEGTNYTVSLHLDALTQARTGNGQVDCTVTFAGPSTSALSFSPTSVVTSTTLSWIPPTKPLSTAQSFTLYALQDSNATLPNANVNFMNGTLLFSTKWNSFLVNGQSTPYVSSCPLYTFDDDMSGVEFSGTDALYIAEGRVNGSYGMRLRSQPSASVCVSITPVSGSWSGTVLRPSVDERSVCFSASDWSAWKNVTVAVGEDEFSSLTARKGFGTFTLMHATSSTDAVYNALTYGFVPTGPNVTVSVADVTRGIISALPLSPLLAVKSLRAGTYRLALSSRPREDIYFSVASVSAGSAYYGGVSPAVVVVNASNWQTGALMSVYARPDVAFNAAPVSFTLQLRVVSSGPWDNTTAASITVFVVEASQPVVRATLPQQLLTYAGAALTDTAITASLTAPPVGNVQLALQVNTLTAAAGVAGTVAELSVSPSGGFSLPFNASNYGVAQSGSVSALPSDVDFGSPLRYRTSIAVASSGDGTFTPNSYDVTIANPILPLQAGTAVLYPSRRAGALIGPVRMVLASGAGASYYAVRLLSKPSSAVTFTVGSVTVTPVSATLAFNVSSPSRGDSLTFTSANWDVPQSIAVAIAVGDEAIPSTSSIAITHRLSSADQLYNSSAPGGGAPILPNNTVTAAVVGRSRRAVILDPGSATVSEGMSFTLTVTLPAPPAAGKQVLVKSAFVTSVTGYDFSSLITTSPTRLSFTRTGPQSQTMNVTIGFAPAGTVIGSAAASLGFSIDQAATNADTRFTVILPQAAVPLTILGTISPTVALSTPALTVAADSSVGLSVKLGALPPAGCVVTVQLAPSADASSGIAQLAVSPSLLNFTSLNALAWQTVVVAPAQDALVPSLTGWTASVLATAVGTGACVGWTLAPVLPSPQVSVSVVNVAAPALLIATPQVYVLKGDAPAPLAWSLASRPTAPVTLTLRLLPVTAGGSAALALASWPVVLANGTALSGGAGAAASASVTIAPGDFASPAPLLLSVADDEVFRGLNLTGLLCVSASSADPAYNFACDDPSTVLYTGSDALRGTRARPLPSANISLIVLESTVACRLNCPVGMFQSLYGANTTCAPCPAGYTCAGGCTAPLLCGAGTSSAPGSGACVSCAVGFAGTSSCDICAAGRVAPSTGLTSCTACAAGYVALLNGSTVCTSCGSGSYASSDSARCVSCDSRSYRPYNAAATDACTATGTGQAPAMDGLTAISCRPGEYADATASSCVKCAAGKYNDASAAGSCADCPAGKYSLDGARECAYCPRGTESNSSSALLTGAGSCRHCSGLYNGSRVALPSAGSTSCTACAVGKAPDNAWGTCVSCAAGYFDLTTGTRANCTACPAGTFSTAAGNYGTVAVAPYGSGLTGGCTVCPLGKANSATGATACYDCPAGTYTVYNGSAACLPCNGLLFPNGTCIRNIAAGYVASYSSTTGAVTLVACAAGTFRQLQDPNTCTACPKGSYSAANASSACTPCTPGSFAQSAGLTTCTYCPGGRYSYKAGASTCHACSPGQHTAGLTNATACTACAPGNYSDISGAGNCFMCLPGRYANSSGSTTCAACPGNSIAATAGAASCTWCGGGYQPNAALDACSLCEVGRANANGSACDVCAPGTAAPARGTANCSVCAAGRYSAGGLTGGGGACVSCPAGSEAPSPGSSTCSTCAAGKYAPAGTPSCLTCPAKSVAVLNGSSACTACAGGFVAPSGRATACVLCAPGRAPGSSTSSTCSTCAPGTYAPGGGPSEVCLPCPIGSATSAFGASSCSVCTPGRFTSDVRSTSCEVCALGFVHANVSASAVADGNVFLPLAAAAAAADATAGGACVPCPWGTVSDHTGTVCEACPAGQIHDVGTNDCVDCGPGFFTAGAGGYECLPCPAGTYIGVGGATACTACAAGPNVYSLPGASACTVCTPGLVSAGGTGCAMCDAGKYQANASDTACTLCAAGRFSVPGIGVTACDACQPGSISPAAGSSTCTLCINGTYQPHSGMTACNACPAQYYRVTAATIDLSVAIIVNSTAIAGSCAQCAPGTVSDGSRTSCVACVPGYYATPAACALCSGNTVAVASLALNCTACPLGTVASVDKRTCLPCSPGFYHANVSDSLCTPAPAGSYVSIYGGANASITPCAKGTYSPPPGGASACTLCESGRYAGVTGLSVCPACAPHTVRTNPFGATAASGPTLAAACISCGPGERSADGRCLACNPGTYGNPSTNECLPCANNTVSAANASACSAITVGYVVNAGHDNATACPVGTYHAGTADEYCTPCAPGRFSAATAATACSDCGPGTYADYAGFSACLLCANGFYSNATGASTCSLCPARSYRNNNPSSLSIAAAPLATNCSVCGAGNVSISSRLGCVTCPSGTYQSGDACVACDLSQNLVAVTGGLTSCTQCTPGSVASSVRLCSDCTPGTFHDFLGTGTCVACPLGFFSENAGSTACTPCPNNTVADDVGMAQCRSCGGGEFAPNATACVKCPDRYVNFNSSQCTLCPLGLFASPTRDNCVSCDPGTYLDPTAPATDGCQPCAGNSVSAAAATGCTQCDAGRYHQLHTSCYDCDAGYYNDNSTEICLACPAGFTSEVKAGFCTPVVPGYYSPLDATYPALPCAVGFYSPQPGAVQCLNCTLGSVAVEGSVGCTDCLPGTYSDRAADECSLCNPGYATANYSSTFCDACAAGRFTSIDGATGCAFCDPGFFSASPGSLECIQCTRGRYAGGAATTCVDCALGYFSTDDGATNCTACGYRQFTRRPGSVECESCDPGFVSARADGANGTGPATGCSRCAKGYAQLDDACAPCGPGNFSDFEGATRCSICPSGKYSNGYANEVCTVCDGGSISQKEGALTCDPCLSGTYSEPGGSTCIDCAPGFYAYGLSNTGCTLCDPGYYAAAAATAICAACPPGNSTINLFGMSNCPACTPGRFAAVAGSANCTVTPPGYYTSDTGAIAPVPCAPGSAHAFQEQTSCPLCTVGRAAASVASTSCDLCGTGRYAGVPGLANCTDCGFNEAAPVGSAYCTQCGPAIPGTIADPATGKSKCVLCPAGAQRIGDVCFFCPPGFGAPKQPTTGSLREDCPICQPGRYAPVASPYGCMACDAAQGQYAPTAGAASCLNASTGFVVNGVNATLQFKCEAGYIPSVEDRTKCDACPLGRYNNDSATGSCEICPAGRFQPLSSAGFSTCFVCAEGSYKPNNGSGLCASCSEGYISDAARTTCVLCDSTRFTCAAKRAIIPPTGAWFEGNISRVEDIIQLVTVAGGASMGTTDLVHPCLSEAACATQSLVVFTSPDATMSPVFPADLCPGFTDYSELLLVDGSFNSTACGGVVAMGNLMFSRCAPGHTGVLCAQCEDGFVHDWEKALCIPCGDSESSIQATVVLVVATLVIFVAFVRQPFASRSHAIAAFRILIIYSQLLAVLSVFENRRDSTFAAFNDVVRKVAEPVFRMLTPLQCNLGWRFNELLPLALASPIFFFVLAFIANMLFLVLRWLVELLRPRLAPPGQRVPCSKRMLPCAVLWLECLDKTILSGILIVYIAIFAITSWTFQVFVMYPEPIQGERHLRADFRIVEGSPELKRLQFMAYIGIGVYQLLLPLLSFLYIYIGQGRMTEGRTLADPAAMAEAHCCRWLCGCVSKGVRWRRCRALYDGTAYPGSTSWYQRLLRQKRSGRLTAYGSGLKGSRPWWCCHGADEQIMQAEVGLPSVPPGMAIEADAKAAAAAAGTGSGTDKRGSVVATGGAGATGKGKRKGSTAATAETKAAAAPAAPSAIAAAARGDAAAASSSTVPIGGAAGVRRTTALRRGATPADFSLESISVQAQQAALASMSVDAEEVVAAAGLHDDESYATPPELRPSAMRAITTCNMLELVAATCGPCAHAACSGMHGTWWYAWAMHYKRSLVVFVGTWFTFRQQTMMFANLIVLVPILWMHLLSNIFETWSNPKAPPFTMQLNALETLAMTANVITGMLSLMVTMAPPDAVAPAERAIVLINVLVFAILLLYVVAPFAILAIRAVQRVSKQREWEVRAEERAARDGTPPPRKPCTPHILRNTWLCFGHWWTLLEEPDEDDATRLLRVNADMPPSLREYDFELLAVRRRQRAAARRAAKRRAAKVKAAKAAAKAGGAAAAADAGSPGASTAAPAVAAGSAASGADDSGSGSDDDSTVAERALADAFRFPRTLELSANMAGAGDIAAALRKGLFHPAPDLETITGSGSGGSSRRSSKAVEAGVLGSRRGSKDSKASAETEGEGAGEGEGATSSLSSALRNAQQQLVLVPIRTLLLLLMRRPGAPLTGPGAGAGTGAGAGGAGAGAGAGPGGRLALPPISAPGSATDSEGPGFAPSARLTRPSSARMPPPLHLTVVGEDDDDEDEDGEDDEGEDEVESAGDADADADEPDAEEPEEDEDEADSEAEPDGEQAADADSDAIDVDVDVGAGTGAGAAKAEDGDADGSDDDDAETVTATGAATVAATATPTAPSTRASWAERGTKVSPSEH